MVIGRVLSIDELLEQGYEAVFVGSGAGLPRFMGIPGENLAGVYSANEFLTRINLMKAYRPVRHPLEHARRVAVVGGGNVAMDAARAPSAWGPRKCTSSTAAVGGRDARPGRKSSTPRKRASSSTC